ELAELVTCSTGDADAAGANTPSASAPPTTAINVPLRHAISLTTCLPGRHLGSSRLRRAVPPRIPTSRGSPERLPAWCFVRSYCVWGVPGSEGWWQSSVAHVDRESGDRDERCRGEVRPDAELGHVARPDGHRPRGGRVGPVGRVGAIGLVVDR